MCLTPLRSFCRVSDGSCICRSESFGECSLYVLAKRLEANDDNVAFCGALDWTAAVVLMSYSLELIPQDSVPSLIARFHGLSKPETVQSVHDVSRPEQRAKLNLDMEQLPAKVNVTDNLAKTYHPQGQVEKIDVFFCTPLRSVERDWERWAKGQLSEWSDISRAEVG